MTLADYDRVLSEQGGGCAICRSTDPGFGRTSFVIDHDHGCCPGEITCGACLRGLLCFRCNLLLGNADDDLDRLTSAMSYLLRATSVLEMT